MDKNNMISKGLVFGIILVVVGAIVVPSISGSTRKTSYITEDYTPPTVEITKPHYNMLYLFNKEFFQIGFAPIIIGKIDIEVNASDDDSGIEKVEFYIDGELKANDTTEPYSWTWGTIEFFQHQIKVIAYDNADNNATADTYCWKFF